MGIGEGHHVAEGEAAGLVCGELEAIGAAGLAEERGEARGEGEQRAEGIAAEVVDVLAAEVELKGLFAAELRDGGGILDADEALGIVLSVEVELEGEAVLEHIDGLQRGGRSPARRVEVRAGLGAGVGASG